jgi:hypothetical protein
MVSLTDLPQESYMEVFPCPAYTNLINLTSTCRYSHSMRTVKPVSHALLHFVRPVIWHGRGNTCHGCRLYMIEVSAHTRDRLPCYNFLRLLSQLEPSPEDWDTQHCPVRSGSVFTAVRAVNAMFCWEKDPMSTELEPLPGFWATFSDRWESGPSYWTIWTSRCSVTTATRASCAVSSRRSSRRQIAGLRQLLPLVGTPLSPESAMTTIHGPAEPAHRAPSPSPRSNDCC